MEIKRKFEWQVATKRRFIVHLSSTKQQIFCPECGEPMLTAEQTAGVFGITQRSIFQIIETKPTHFTELDSVVMICLDSLAKTLNSDN